MKCPICDIEMRIADREGVEIDYCPQCRGVWLDRGELEKIIARVESEQSRGRDERNEEEAEEEEEDKDRRGDRGAGPYRDDSQRREGEYEREGKNKNEGKKKEGFFSNLLDMFGD
jgi:Zn-finger nucleic acid-binding protein